LISSQKNLSDQFAYIYTFEFEATKERLSRLEYDQNKLSKQVNFKVEAMTEQVEKEFA
jgi:structural maintenance of chromosome 2